MVQCSLYVALPCRSTVVSMTSIHMLMLCAQHGRAYLRSPELARIVKVHLSMPLYRSEHRLRRRVFRVLREGGQLVVDLLQLVRVPAKLYVQAHALDQAWRTFSSSSSTSFSRSFHRSEDPPDSRSSWLRVTDEARRAYAVSLVSKSASSVRHCRCRES